MEARKPRRFYVINWRWTNRWERPNVGPWAYVLLTAERPELAIMIGLSARGIKFRVHLPVFRVGFGVHWIRP